MSTPVDELRLVRDFFGEVPEIDDLAAERARRRLRARTAPRPRRLARLLVVAAALAGISLVALAWLPGTTGAAQALQRLSSVALDLDLAAGRGPVVYERSERLFPERRLDLETGDAYRFTVRSSRDLWRTARGTSVSFVTVNDVDFLRPRDEAAWDGAGRPPIPAAGDEIQETDEPIPLPNLTGLPADPDALLDEIRERWEPDELATDAQLLRAVGELLARGDATPELRADLFRAAATIPGIELLGPTRDPLDREGLGLALASGDRRVTLVVDPQTSVLLSVEERFVLEGDPVTEWIAYSGWATVPEIGDRPGDAGIV